MKRFVPLIDRFETPRGKIMVILAGICACVLISVIVDRVYAMPVEEYHYTNAKASHNRMVTVKTWHKNRYGDYVPYYVHGHAYCKVGYYPVFSKYTGATCESHKQDRKATKAAIKCASYIIVGRYFGGVAGGRAAAAGCGIDFLL